jgi:DNA-binding response OmpR family regulator
MFGQRKTGAQAQPRGWSASRENGATGESKGLIVIVEDERAIADLGCNASTSAKPDSACMLERDGLAGLASIRRLHPVAVVLDVGLLGLDGIEICRQMRAGG